MPEAKKLCSKIIADKYTGIVLGVQLVGGPGVSENINITSLAITVIGQSLQPPTREVLHERIQERLNMMLNNDFLEEVKVLHQRPELTAKHPSMRSVGYRQIWEHLDGETSFDEAKNKALFATRQLAKRQITWLRSESDLNSFDPLEVGCVDAISAFLADKLE